jgi:acetyltransferase-like isoleucine patch superfamily enzyme
MDIPPLPTVNRRLIARSIIDGMPTAVGTGAAHEKVQAGDRLNLLARLSRRLRRDKIPSFVEVGRHTYFGPDVEFRWGKGANERIVIGRYCSIAGKVAFVVGNNHATETVSTFPFDARIVGRRGAPDRSYRTTRETLVGNDVWIGEGAYVRAGVTIGDGAVVGARAVVSRDVPPYSIVVGNPAKAVRLRFDEATVARLLALRWWDWADDKVLENVDWFYGPVEDFLDHFEADNA